jgi:hypothetical protein
MMCPGSVINLLFLPFSMFLYLVYKGEWLDLTWGSPGDWDWDWDMKSSPVFMTSLKDDVSHIPIRR